MDENKFNGQTPDVNNQVQPNSLSQPEFSQQQIQQVPEFSRNYQDTINKQIQNVPPVQNDQTVSSYAEFVRSGGFDKPKNNLAGKIAFSVILLIVVIAAVLFLTIKNEKVLTCTQHDDSTGIPITFKFYLTYINDDFDSIDVAFSANLDTFYDSMVDSIKEQWQKQGEELKAKGYKIEILDEKRVVTLTAEASASNFTEDYRKDVAAFYKIDTAKSFFNNNSYTCEVTDGGK